MLPHFFKKMIPPKNIPACEKATDKDVPLRKIKDRFTHEDVLNMDAVEIVKYSQAQWKMLEDMVSKEITANREGVDNSITMAEEMHAIRDRIDNLLAKEHILQAHIENMENLHREKLMFVRNERKHI